MSYARLDEGLPDHPKWAPLTDAAFRLAVRSICWARKPERQRKRPGFIPNAMLMNLARRTPAMAARMAEELVNAGKPMHEEGIWVPVDGGWLIHDFDDYGPATILEPVRATSKSEAGRLGGLRSAESRREASGSASPKQTVSASEANGQANDVASEAEPRSTTEAPPKHPSDPNSRSTWKLSGSPDPDRSGSDQIPPLPPTEPTASADSTTPRRPRKAPATKLPAGFALSPGVLAWSTAKGWPEWWARNRFDGFVQLAAAKSWRYADWDAALRNFLGNEVVYKRGPVEMAHLAPRASSPAPQDEATRRRLAAAVEARARGGSP